MSLVNKAVHALLEAAAEVRGLPGQMRVPPEAIQRQLDDLIKLAAGEAWLACISSALIT